MNSHPPLAGSHLQTYNTIFQHPVSHNLNWRAVRALLASIGELVEEANGNWHATRNGQSLVLHPSRTKDVAEIDTVMALRHYLERSEAPAPPAAAGHWLLVIDHHEARLFRSEMHGAIPHQIHPYEPEGYFRHAPHSRDFTRGQEKPDPASFFEPVARALPVSGPILIFGTGTGMGSEMDQFVSWLTQHHAELARHIIGKVVIDEQHLTTDQLLAKARAFYTAATAAIA